MQENGSNASPNIIPSLIRRFHNLVAGKSNSYLEEEEFEQLIYHYEDTEAYEQALEVSRYATSQFPYSQALVLSQVNILLLMSKYEEALHTLDEQISGNTLTLEMIVLRLDALLALNREDEADALWDDILAIYDAAIEDKDETIDHLFDLCDLYDDYEAYNRVVDCLLLLLQLDPNNEEALFKICYWVEFTGRCEESIQLHKQIVEDYPYNELAWFNLGAAYQGIKLHEKAIECYEFCIAINDKFEYAYRNIGDAYIRIRKYSKAIESLKELLTISNAEPVIFEAIGHCYDKLKLYAKARYYYKKASVLNLEDLKMLYHIALTYRSEERWNQAITYLQIICNKSKLNADYNLALGQCYVEIGRFEEAITCLGIVVRTRPKFVTGWQELLTCLYKGGYYEDGLEYADFALEQTDGKSIFVYFKSLFLYALGQGKEGFLYLEKALISNPKLLKRFIEINPAMLQMPSVVDLVARHKKKKRI